MIPIATAQAQVLVSGWAAFCREKNSMGRRSACRHMRNFYSEISEPVTLSEQRRSILYPSSKQTTFTSRCTGSSHQGPSRLARIPKSTCRPRCTTQPAPASCKRSCKSWRWSSSRTNRPYALAGCSLSWLCVVLYCWKSQLDTMVDGERSCFYGVSLQHRNIQRCCRASMGADQKAS